MNRPHQWLAAIHPESGKPVLVRYGDSGYWGDPEGLAKSLIAEQNILVTEAALAGSMFGWDCPGAAAAREFVRQRMRAWRAEKLLSFLQRFDLPCTLEPVPSLGIVRLTANAGVWSAPTLEELIDGLPEPG